MKQSNWIKEKDFQTQIKMYGTDPEIITNWIVLIKTDNSKKL